MTRTARYNADTNSLRELPGMEKPRPPHTGWFSMYYDIYRKKLTSYNKHVASLREIPCHESCRSVFKDQGVYEEDREYVIGVYPVNEMRSDEPKYLAYPAPVKSEDELWAQVVSRIFAMQPTTAFTDEIVTELKKHYTLTPR